VAAEEARKASISSKAAIKDAALADLYKQRKKEHDLKKVETDFELKLRLDKVDALAKNGLYKRQQGLEKIMTAADNTRSILRERETLKATRKQSNMQAALERQKMQASMDQMKTQSCS
jgi:phosphopantothenoylcysteine synthetase/decarboxylase